MGSAQWAGLLVVYIVAVDVAGLLLDAVFEVVLHTALPGPAGQEIIGSLAEYNYHERPEYSRRLVVASRNVHQCFGNHGTTCLTSLLRPLVEGTRNMKPPRCEPFWSFPNDSAISIE